MVGPSDTVPESFRVPYTVQIGLEPAVSSPSWRLPGSLTSLPPFYLLSILSRLLYPPSHQSRAHNGLFNPMKASRTPYDPCCRSQNPGGFLSILNPPLEHYMVPMPSSILYHVPPPWFEAGAL